MKSKKQMPNSWDVVRLEDVAEINQSNWTRGQSSTILYLDLTSVIGPGILATPKELAARNAPSRARRQVRPGDILVSTVRPNLQGFARVPKAPRNLVASTGFAVVSPRRIVNGSFVYQHVMTSRFAQYLENAATGQAYPAVLASDVAGFTLPLPPLPEQRAIAAVLDSIDEAIERTEAVIAATEHLRDALLHKLLTRGVLNWHSEWKDAPGIGTIPACWEVVSLGEVYEVQLGKMLSPKARQGRNPRPYLTNRNVRWGEFDLSDLSAMDFDHREIEKFQLRPGDLLVCEGGDTGRAAIWLGEIADCYYQKALHRLRPIDENVISEFMLAVLMSYATKGILLEHSERTSISHLTRERLLRMRIANPSRPEQEHIVAVLRSAATRIRNAQAEREALAVLKTSAAAVLLTGSLRVGSRLEDAYG